MIMNLLSPLDFLRKMLRIAVMNTQGSGNPDFNKTNISSLWLSLQRAKIYNNSASFALAYIDKCSVGFLSCFSISSWLSRTFLTKWWVCFKILGKYMASNVHRFSVVG